MEVFVQSMCIKKLYSSQFMFINFGGRNWLNFCKFLIFILNSSFLVISFNVSLQIWCLRKWFVTKLTFVIFVAFMNSMDVALQMKCMRKCSMFNIHIYDLCGLYELCGCVSSKFLLQKMIFHKIYICNLCGLHELSECGSSRSQQ